MLGLLWDEYTRSASRAVRVSVGPPIFSRAYLITDYVQHRHLLFLSFFYLLLLVFLVGKLESVRVNSKRSGQRRKQAGSGFLISFALTFFLRVMADRPFVFSSSCLSGPSLGGTWTNRLRWSSAAPDCLLKDMAYRIQTTSRSSLYRYR